MALHSEPSKDQPPLLQRTTTGSSDETDFYDTLFSSDDDEDDNIPQIGLGTSNKKKRALSSNIHGSVVPPVTAAEASGKEQIRSSSISNTKPRLSASTTPSTTNNAYTNRYMKYLSQFLDSFFFLKFTHHISFY
jgi:hypothetical protein